MKNGRPSVKVYALIYIAIIAAIAVLANYAGNRFFVRGDLTENNIYTISDNTKERLRAIDDIITVDVFFSENLPARYQKVQTAIMDLLTEFKRYAGGYLVVKTHDPTTSNDDLSLALALDIEKTEITDIAENRLGKVYGYAGIAVRYKNRTERLNTITSVASLERKILQQIITLTTPELPKIGILKTDTITPIPREMIQKYQMKQPSQLTSQRYRNLYDILLETYQVEHISLKKGDIPGDISTLVIPGGSPAFLNNEEYLRKIDRFAAQGGNLFVLAPRLDVDLNEIARQPQISFKNSRFYKLLEQYGITVGETIILDRQCDNIYASENRAYKYPYFPVITRDGLGDHPITSSLGGVILQWVSPMWAAQTAEGDTSPVVDTLLETSKNSYGNTPPIGLAPNQDWDRLFQQAENKDTPFGPFPVALALENSISPYYPENRDITSTGQNRIVAVGSDNFVTKNGLGLNNKIFIQNSCDWLNRRTDLLSIPVKNIADRRLAQKGIKNSSPRAQIIRAVNIALMPLLICGIGLVIYARRRKIERTALQNSKKGGAHE
ncbi:MAG: GldG family protein [Fibrobacterota bacterium]